MIGSTRRVSVFAYREPVDMRKSFDALAGLVTERMGRDVLAGEMFLFVSRDRRKARVLFYDGTGLCLFCKRLARGQFSPPWASDAGMTMTPSELSLFLEGSRLAGTIPLSPAAFDPAPAVSNKDFGDSDAF
jgi:transposase